MADVTFLRSEEQAMLGATLRDLLDATVDLDRTKELSLTSDAFDRPAWNALVEMGIVGLHLPDEHGGADSPFTDVAVVFEELGRVVAAVPLLSTMMASRAIQLAGDESQRSEWLPSLASGASISTVAFSEHPHHDGRSAETTAEPTADGGWHVRGVKRFVTDAVNADILVVTAATNEGIRLFVVPTDAEGLTVAPVNAIDPTRPLADVTLDVEVPASSRLAADDTASVIDDVLAHGVVAMAAEQVGGAARCLESSVAYAKERYQFGRAIGSFQAIKHRCADMLVAVEHARSVAWHAAATIDDPAEAIVMVPVTKSVCSDAYVRAAGDAIQIFGGIGFTWEHDAHLFFKRAKADSLLLGSVGSHRDRLGSAIGV